MTSASEAIADWNTDSRFCAHIVNGEKCGNNRDRPCHKDPNHPHLHLFKPPENGPAAGTRYDYDISIDVATCEPHIIARGIYATKEQVYEHEWAYPDDEEQGPLPTFPVNTLPGDLGKFAHALAVYHQVAVDVPALLLLGGMSVLIGGYVRVTGQWTENTVNLYLAPIIGSGELKSPLVRAVARPILNLETKVRKEYDDEYGPMKDLREIACTNRDRLIKKIADAEGQKRKDLMAELEDIKKEIENNTPPPRPTFLAQDVTPEALAREMRDTGGHIGMLTDEGGFLGTLAGRYTKGNVANIDLVLQAFDAAMPYRRSRVGSDSYEIERPSLSMTLCVQPAIIRSAVESVALLDLGLLYRFLFAKVTSLAGSRDKRPPKTPGYLHDAWAGAVNNIYESVLPKGPYDPETKRPRPPMSLEVSETAEELHYRWRVELERRVDPDEGDLAHLTGWAKKLEGAVYRIAALLHLASGNPGHLVGDQAMRDAVAIGNWAIPHAVAVFGSGQVGDPDQSATDKACTAVLAWIRRKGIQETTVRQVNYALKRQTWVRQTGAEGVRAALVALVQRGYLVSVANTSADGKQLADGLFLVHPRLHGSKP